MIETISTSQNSEKIASLSKVTDSHEQTLQEVKKQLQIISTFMQKWANSKEHRRKSSQSRGCLVNATGSNEGYGTLPLGPIKNLRLEFPRFQGEDPTCWIYKANQFFSYHNTLEHYRVLMASFHLDGEALIWFQEAEQERGFASWEVFVQALQTQFGATAYDDQH